MNLFLRRFAQVLNFLILAVVCIVSFGTRSVAAANTVPIKVVSYRHTLVLLSDGSVVGWGPCDRGQLGPVAAIPQRRTWATALVSIKLPGKAVDIAASEEASLALLDDGTVVAWGSNYKNLLGNPNIEGKSENPVRVGNLSNVAQIAADGGGALALLKNGTVYAWGETFKGKFGDGRTPTQISGLSNITKISVGNWHFLALDASNRVWMGGVNFCTVGKESTDAKPVVQVPELTDVTAIAAGSCVSTAVKKDGTVWVWGSNGMAGFGNGQQTTGGVLQTAPQQVAGIRNVVAVTSGGMGRHTLVLLKDGTLRGWGNSDWGQIGAGISGDFQLSPVVPKISNVKAVFAASNNSFAVKNDNTFWIWGTGDYGLYPLRKNQSVPQLLELK